jgi:4Fe-4S ferredoxin
MTRTAVKPECKQDAGAFHPVIDRNRCEGKGPCVTARPNSVLAISTSTRDERATLSLLGHLKTLAHGSQQAHVVAPMQCVACGECVRVCPEKAITLV